MWLGPHGEIVNLDDEDEPHSWYVFTHEDMFGVSLDAERTQWKADGEHDYDMILAKVEANGWIRISRDVSDRQPHVAAISVNNARNLHRGIRWLQKHGIVLDGVHAEIETIMGDRIDYRYYKLDATDLDAFLQRGVLPRRS